MSGKWQRQYWATIDPVTPWFLTTSLEVDGVSPAGNHVTDSYTKVTSDRIYLVHDSGGTTWYEANIVATIGVVALDLDGTLIWEKQITFDQSHFPATTQTSWNESSFYPYYKPYTIAAHPTETNHLLVYFHFVDSSSVHANIRWYLAHIDEDGAIVTLTHMGADTGNTGDPNVYGDDPQIPVIAVASNGDVWYHLTNFTDRGYVASLDYSSAYAGIAYSAQIDAFDDGTETEGVPVINEDTSLSVMLSDGTTFVTLVEGQIYQDPSIIGSINDSGTVKTVDFIHDTGGSGGDEFYYIRNMCADSSTNFYTLVQAVTQGDSDSDLRFVLAKWNSSLVQQWAVEFDELKKSAASSTPLTVTVLTVSPDGQYLYMAGYSGSESDLYGITIDVTDGSVVTDWRVDIQTPTGQEEVLLKHIEASDDFLVISGVYRDSTHDEPGYAVGKIPQKLFDMLYLDEGARTLFVGKFRKTSWSSPPYTTASVTLTTTSPITTKSVWAPTTPTSALTEGLYDGVRDLPTSTPDVDYVRTFASKQFYGVEY